MQSLRQGNGKFLNNVSKMNYYILQFRLLNRFLSIYKYSLHCADSGRHHTEGEYDMADTAEIVLEVKDLDISFRSAGETVHAIRGVNRRERPEAENEVG